MRTFISWIIANIETLTNILVIISFEIGAISGALATTDENLVAVIILGPVLVLLVKSLLGSYPSKDTIVDIFNLIMLLMGTAVIFIISREVSEDTFTKILVVVTLLLSFIAAVISAIFTFKNIDEVASKRMLYRNSNVDMFSYSLKYSFNRFVSVFTSFANTVYLCVFGPAVWEFMTLMQ